MASSLHLGTLLLDHKATYFVFIEGVRKLSNLNKMRCHNDFYVKLTIKLGMESLQRKLMSPFPSHPISLSSNKYADLFYTVDS